MNKEQINNLIKYLEEIKINKKYIKHHQLIKKLLNNTKLLLNENNLSNKLLDEIEKDINVLNVYYVELDDLDNIFCDFNTNLRRKIKQKYVEELRKNNREKRLYKGSENMENNKNYEIEEALAKLYFYINICLLDKNYEQFYNEYKKLLKIVKKWNKYYAKNRNLNKISNKEINNFKDIFYNIPFKDYTGFYYFEYVDAFLDKVIYYTKK